MELSSKSITLFAAIVLTGLSAGLFYAWAVSVIPGTRRVMDMTYLETMQQINRAILNPAFFAVFMGSFLLLAVSAVQQFGAGSTFWLIAAAAVVYLMGTFGVTALGNVPLNNGLDVITLSELDPGQIAHTRATYELRWNRLHMIRTVFSVLSFLLALGAAFSSSRIG